MNDANVESPSGGGGIRTSPTLRRAVREAADCLREHETFLVASHREPDGDAIASTLGLALVIEQLGKTAVRFNLDDVPYNCEFLDGAERVRDAIPEGFRPDVIVLLDCSDYERIGWAAGEEPAAKQTLVIDHHRTVDETTGDVYLHDEKAAATGELIYRLACELGSELTIPFAECIYTALMMDTGSFQYSNTSATTYRIAADLMEAGLDAWEMALELNESQPRRRVELLSEVLQSLEFGGDGRVAFIRIDRSMIDDDERVAQLTDGFINYGRSIRGVEVSVQMRESAEGGWRVTFRSKGRVDVSAIASRFGGGGHANAAGCTMDLPPERIREQLTETVVDLLDESD